MGRYGIISSTCGPWSVGRGTMAEVLSVIGTTWRSFVEPVIDAERSGQLRPYVRPVARHRQPSCTHACQAPPPACSSTSCQTMLNSRTSLSHHAIQRFFRPPLRPPYRANVTPPGRMPFRPVDLCASSTPTRRAILFASAMSLAGRPALEDASDPQAGCAFHCGARQIIAVAPRTSNSYLLLPLVIRPSCAFLRWNAAGHQTEPCCEMSRA